MINSYLLEIHTLFLKIRTEIVKTPHLLLILASVSVMEWAPGVVMA